LNNLAESDGLSLDDMKKQMTVHTINLNKHIEKLVADSIIQSVGGRYSLTKDGKNLYMLVQQVAQKIKTD
jgi:predicted transcriptional regulator